MEHQQEQKVFLVTGSSSGLGLCLCREIIASGQKVIATMRIPNDVQNWSLDWKQAERQNVYNSMSQQKIWKKDYKNVSRYGYGGPLESLQLPSMHLLTSTLFFGPLRTCKSLIPHFRTQAGGGTIINIGSAASIQGLPGLSIYGACKSALANATEALHGELAPFGIHGILAEMSDMRTNLLEGKGNLKVEDVGEVYRGTPADLVLGAVREMHGKQDVDPVRCARKIVEIGLGNGGWDGKFVRLPLGKQYLDAVRMKNERLEENMRDFEDGARDCDFGD